MRSRRVEYGSFRARMDDLVPMLGLDRSPIGQGSDEPPRAVVGLHGSPAYRINQYLFDRSRR